LTQRPLGTAAQAPEDLLVQWGKLPRLPAGCAPLPGRRQDGREAVLAAVRGLHGGGCAPHPPVRRWGQRTAL